ncbi:Protein CBR-AIN-1 [Caenorhabditis briggsae]|uniref:Protein CBR-AIN-1 n=1 Tax=Caenorhabditis briggsae TaxID=6238 RepID=A8XNM7_CAEBR|nr:Protein CBR-AIN-1 [Caenorhabditis briggsae]CAP34116.2 Protein CBR-AIN-1 [Caenorhabditis briggsae]
MLYCSPTCQTTLINHCISFLRLLNSIQNHSPSFIDNHFFYFQLTSNSDRQSAINATMESLERSLNNISIDDSSWRPHDQQQPQQSVWSNGGVPHQPGRGPGGGAVWAPPVPQFQNRPPWQQEPNDMEQNVNETLGLGGMPPSQTPQWGGMPNSEYDNKQIWADPASDVQYPPPPAHAPFGALNGIGGPNGDWSMGSQPNHQPWSNGGMGKESDEFWKNQPPHQQPQYPMPLLQGAWNPRGMNHGPPGQGSRGGPMMQQQDYQSGWGGPNNMGGNKQMNRQWGHDNNRGMQMGQRNGRPNHNQGRYNANIDVSVPPPMDMHGGMGGNMRNMGGPPNGNHGWKNTGGMGGGGGGGGGGRYGGNNYNNRGGGNMGHQGGNQGGNNMWNNGGGGNGGNQGSMQQYGMGDQSGSQFSVGGAADDLTLSVWHDPNGELKKWQRDTGVSYWGDPEKQNDKTINLWLVAEGADEDLETALNRCPVPQKKEHGGEDTNQRFPFPIPAKRPIVVTGWGELPENDPNNPNKTESNIFEETNRWNDVATEQNPWYLPNHNANNFSADNTTGSWVQGGTIPINEPGNHINIPEMLKNAVAKGYLDQCVPMLANLPQTVLKYVNMLLVKIPALESVEDELKQIVESSRPDDSTEIDPQNQQKYMNDSQKLEHNRLIIEVTTARIEVQDYSKKVNRALIEAGIVHPQEQRAPAAAATSEEYHYSFLE